MPCYTEGICVDDAAKCFGVFMDQHLEAVLCGFIKAFGIESIDKLDYKDMGLDRY